MFEPLERRVYSIYDVFQVRSFDDLVFCVEDAPLLSREWMKEKIERLKKHVNRDIVKAIDKLESSILSELFIKSISWITDEQVRYFKFYLLYVLTFQRKDAEIHNANVKKLFKNKSEFLSMIGDHTRLYTTLMRGISREEEFKAKLKECQEGKRFMDIMADIKKSRMKIDCPLEALWKSGYATDCTIVVSTGEVQKEYPCHRLILASFSEMLKTQFENDEKFRSDGGNRFTVVASPSELNVMDFFFSLPYYGIHYTPFENTRTELFNVFGGKEDREIATLLGLCEKFIVSERLIDQILKHVSSRELIAQLQILSSVPFSKNRISFVASFSDLTKSAFLKETSAFDLDESVMAVAFYYCSCLD